MKRREVLKLITGLLGGGWLVTACRENVEFSPYQNQLSNDRMDLNKGQLEQIRASYSDNSKFKIAIVTDTHNYYDQFNAAVDSINSNKEVDFVIHAGDLTEKGYEKEYILTHNILKRLNKPYLAVVGNHEYFTYNGGNLYNTMFGQVNFTFFLGNKKFIFFDSNQDISPFDIDWFEHEVSDMGGAKDIYVITHAPSISYTFDGDANKEMKDRFEAAMANQNVKLTVFGHEHYHRYDQDKKWLLVDYIKNRNYIVLDIDDNGYSFERVFV